MMFRRAILLSLLLVAQIASHASSRRFGFRYEDDDYPSPLDDLPSSGRLQQPAPDEDYDDSDSDDDNHPGNPRGSADAWRRILGSPPNKRVTPNRSRYHRQGHLPSETCGLHSPQRDLPGYLDLARLSEFPSHALVTPRYQGHAMNVCGGTIISDTVVLTSAHCLKNDSYSPDSVDVYAGDINVESIPQFRGRRACVPKEALDNLNDFDIAVVVVEKPFTWSDTIQPACLPDAPLSFDHRVSAVGFGIMTVPGTRFDVAQMLPVIRTNNCPYNRQDYSACYISNDPSNQVTFCRGHTEPQLYVNDDGKQYIVGVAAGELNRFQRSSHCSFSDTFKLAPYISRLARLCPLTAGLNPFANIV